MAYATRWLPASIVSTVFSALEPVWVTLFQWLLLAEKLQPLTLIGNLVATLGIAMLCRAQYYDSKVLTTADERLLLAAEPE
jgi:drug/metabolite transporter (DMT)-like permease